MTPQRLMLRLYLIIGLVGGVLMLPLAWYVVMNELSDTAQWIVAFVVSFGIGGGGIAAAWIAMELRFPGYLTGGGRK